MRNKSDEFKRIILHFRRKKKRNEFKKIILNFRKKKKKKNIYMARFMEKLKK